MTSVEQPLTGYLVSGLERLKASYPEVHDWVISALSRLGSARDVHDYQAVGLLCRDALILFAQSVFSPSFVSGLERTPRQDEVMRHIELTLQHFGQLAGSEKLRRLVKSVWDYTLRTQHDRDVTKEAAERTALYSVATLIELSDLIEAAAANERLVQRYGVYMCPACHSTELIEEGWSDGFSGGNYLLCRECGWDSER